MRKIIFILLLLLTAFTTRAGTNTINLVQYLSYFKNQISILASGIASINVTLSQTATTNQLNAKLDITNGIAINPSVDKITAINTNSSLYSVNGTNCLRWGYSSVINGYLYGNWTNDTFYTDSVVIGGHRLYWSPEEYSLVMESAFAGTSLTYGGEISTVCRNNESFTLNNGDPVYIIPNGLGPVKRVGLASCMIAEKDDFFGLVTIDNGIVPNSFGMVTSFGRTKMNTSLWDEGARIYLCDGKLTNGIPITTNAIWFVGNVEYKHAQNGILFVRPQKNGYATLWQLYSKVDINNGISTNQTLYNPQLTNAVIYANSIYLKTNTNYNLPPVIPPVIPSIYKRIEYSSNIVTVNQDNIIYKIDVSSPNTISNDLSQLTLDGVREAKWELWINYLTTNSLSTQWSPRIDFGGYTPDLTVTGQYKFVCSTVDGITIQAKQVYPIPYNLTPVSIPYTGQVLVANNRYYGTITTPHTINIATPFSTNKENNIILCAKFVGTNSVTWGTNLLLYNGQLPVASTNEVDVIYVWSNIQNKWKIGTLEAY